MKAPSRYLHNNLIIIYRKGRHVVTERRVIFFQRSNILEKEEICEENEAARLVFLMRGAVHYGVDFSQRMQWIMF